MAPAWRLGKVTASSSRSLVSAGRAIVAQGGFEARGYHRTTSIADEAQPSTPRSVEARAARQRAIPWPQATREATGWPAGGDAGCQLTLLTADYRPALIDRDGQRRHAREG
jgi:hypothetical protein